MASRTTRRGAKNTSKTPPTTPTNTTDAGVPQDSTTNTTTTTISTNLVAPSRPNSRAASASKDNGGGGGDLGDNRVFKVPTLPLMKPLTQEGLIIEQPSQDPDDGKWLRREEVKDLSLDVLLDYASHHRIDIDVDALLGSEIVATLCLRNEYIPVLPSHKVVRRDGHVAVVSGSGSGRSSTGAAAVNGGASGSRQQNSEPKRKKAAAATTARKENNTSLFLDASGPAKKGSLSTMPTSTTASSSRTEATPMSSWRLFANSLRLLDLQLSFDEAKRLDELRSDIAAAMANQTRLTDEMARIRTERMWRILDEEADRRLGLEQEFPGQDKRKGKGRERVSSEKDGDGEGEGGDGGSASVENGPDEGDPKPSGKGKEKAKENALPTGKKRPLDDDDDSHQSPDSKSSKRPRVKKEDDNGQHPPQPKFLQGRSKDDVYDAILAKAQAAQDAVDAYNVRVAQTAAVNPAQALKREPAYFDVTKPEEE